MTTPPEQPGYGQQPPQGWPAQPAWQPAPYAPVPPTDGMAIAALVVGILGMVGTCAYGLGAIISPIALFLGRASMKRITASQGRIGGHGLAMAGFILGIVGTVILVLVLVMIAFFVILGVNGYLD